MCSSSQPTSWIGFRSIQIRRPGRPLTWMTSLRRQCSSARSRRADYFGPSSSQLTNVRHRSEEVRRTNFEDPANVKTQGNGVKFTAKLSTVALGEPDEQ